MKLNGSHDRQISDENFVHDDPVTDAALEWFSLLRNSEPDMVTTKNFQIWLHENPRHAEEFYLLEKIWGESSFISAVEALNNTQTELPEGWKQKNASGLAMWMSAAAILLIIFGAWHLPDSLLTWQADYVTATGEQSLVILPDGSSMTLNTASAVSVNFENERRSVTLLRGEAFFDVKPDPKHPFQVVAEYGEVTVKGTAFSVRLEDEGAQILVEHGAVDVACLCENGGKVALRPGQSVIATSQALSSVRSTNPTVQLAWREGRISFEDVPVKDVLTELRRYYGGRVFVINDHINQLIITGNYRLDNIEGAIRTLADVANASMTRLPGGILILQ